MCDGARIEKLKLYFKRILHEHESRTLKPDFGRFEAKD
jgi:hypothetical protein